MQLLRSNPAFHLGRVTDFDSWMRQPFAAFPLMGQWLNDVLPGLHQGRPATDVFEDAEHYHVRLELPGVKKEDLKIEVQDRLLQVSAERRETSGGQETSFTLARSLAVPKGVAADGIRAKLENGLLQITLPKQEHCKPRSIEVQ
jgi:HSP20 family protein